MNNINANIQSAISGNENSVGKIYRQMGSLAKSSVERAAADIFGVSALGNLFIIPSITNYVYEVEIGKERYIAKISITGSAKATVAKRYNQLGIQKLMEDQREYAKSQKNAVLKESKQGKFLREHFPDFFAEVIGYKDGVMVSKKIEDHDLLQEMLGAKDKELIPIYSNLAEAISKIHRLSCNPEAVHWISSTFPFNETHTDTLVKFEKKFLSGTDIFAKIASMGKPEDKEQYKFIADKYQSLCDYIHLLINEHDFARRQCAIEGDFKPENILVSKSGNPMMVDAEMHMGRESFDIGRLVSRTSLSLLYDSISPDRKNIISKSIKEFNRSLKENGLPNYKADNFQKESVLVCAMDMLNILSAYLNMPENQLRDYPFNVQENHSNRLVIVEKLSQFFDKNKKGNEFLSLDDFVDYFRG